MIDADLAHVSPFIRTPYAQVWGSPDIDYDYKLFGNLGWELTDELQGYLFANVAGRGNGGIGYYFRNPTTRGGVYLHPDGSRHLAADLRADPDPATVPSVERVVTDDGVVYPHPDDLKEVAGNPGFFTFNEMLPGGFTPKWKGVIKDASLAGGFRGNLESGWSFDAGAVLGHHRVERVMYDTINPQLIAHPDFKGTPGDIPTYYRIGNYEETDYTVNLDWSRPFETEAMHSPLNVVTGLEYRVEEFGVAAGEEYSWWADTRPGGLAEQGFMVGSNGDPGIPDRVAGVTDRGSYAAYGDLEADVIEDVLLGVAVRYEDYEGSVGDTLNGKLAVRWQETEAVALRGSLGTGFRALTLGQASVRAVTSTYVKIETDGSEQFVLRDVATLPVDELPRDAYEDARPLRPEQSVNLSVGTAINWHGWAVTLDYYRISLNDRILLKDPVDWETEDQAGNPIPNPYNYYQIKWFSNDFDTLTQGIDIVASYPWSYAAGDTALALAFNVNDTSVVGGKGSVTPGEIDRLENSLPQARATFGATHRLNAWTLVLPRLRYYGSFIEYTGGVPKSALEAKVLVDVEANYDFGSGLSLAAGARNLFDTYPDELARTTQHELGAIYPETSPFGFDGGFYYFKASYRF